MKDFLGKPVEFYGDAASDTAWFLCPLEEVFRHEIELSRRAGEITSRKLNEAVMKRVANPTAFNDEAQQ